MDAMQVLETQISQLAQDIHLPSPISDRSKYQLGRLMLMAKNRRPWRGRFQHFEDFRSYVTRKYHVSRSVLCDCMAVARAFPELPEKVVSKVPSTSLVLAARAIRKNPKEANRLLKDAAILPVHGYRAMLEDRGYIHRHKRPLPEKVVLRLVVPSDALHDWDNIKRGREDGEAFAELVSRRALAAGA